MFAALRVARAVEVRQGGNIFQRGKSGTANGGPLNVLAEKLLHPALNYAMSHGLVYAAQNLDGDPSSGTQCPVGLLPFKVPAHAFHEAVSWSPIWNRLVDAVSRDTAWLNQTLASAARADPFTGKLMEINNSITSEFGGPRQKIYMGINRSDYMMHEPEGTAMSDVRFLQVELNTIASSFGALSTKTGLLHQYLLGRYGTGSDSVAKALHAHYGLESGPELQAQLPKNETLERIPDALAQAFRIYCGANSLQQGDAVVLFVTQPGERNFADQRALEYALWERSGIRVERRSMRQVCAEGSLDASGKLRLADGQEVAVAYFRAGYTPDDYQCEDDWAGRILIERSMAIKCPSVAYQLVGAKKVQQALAAPGVLQRFLDTEACEKLSRSFAGLWSLGPDNDDSEIVSRAMLSPEQFVMKPQREGGGNNMYGKDIVEKLQTMSREDRGAFIMMQRIMPQPQEAVLTRSGTAFVTPSLSEFGFYSVYLGDGENVMLNEHAGHLVRSKAEGVDEGGVATGYAVVNSPYLMA